jgi:hypothetical protein
MIWFSAIKLAINAGTHIYKKKQETKMLMADGAARHAQKMASGEIEYSGKLLEARQSDWKDEFILIILSMPLVLLGWAVFSDDPFWYQTIFVGVIASVYGLKATDLIKRK